MKQTDTLTIGGGQAGLGASRHLSERGFDHVVLERGEIRRDGGVTAAPGLYVLGMKLQRTRRSTFIDVAGDDARAVSEHIACRLAHPCTAVA